MKLLLLGLLLLAAGCSKHTEVKFNYRFEYFQNCESGIPSVVLQGNRNSAYAFHTNSDGSCIKLTVYVVQYTNTFDY